jgi:1-acyl-sn-glycerol-3-phosphate acyltransferase
MLDQGKGTWDVKLLRGFLYSIMRLLFRIEHRGMEHIPAEGPLIVVANHTTYLDPFLVSVRVYRALRFMAWDKIFAFSLSRRLFTWLGAFPVSLENPEASAFKNSVKILRNNEALMIFPEGGRSPDGLLMPFKEGAGRLAIRLKVPILPVVIHGAVRAWGPGMPLPLPRKIVVEFLPPIQPENFEPSPRDLMDRVAAGIAARLP